MKVLPILIVSLALAVSCGKTFGQSTQVDSVAIKVGNDLNNLFNRKVYMDVDTILFGTKQDNFYFAEGSQAMIMTILAPQSFAKAEEHFDEESSEKEYKLLEKKKLTYNGKNVLYQKGEISKDGKKALMHLWAIETTSESTIFVTGMHMDGDDDKYFPAIERAALSARLR
jgi:hypothetical protein